MKYVKKFNESTGYTTDKDIEDMSKNVIEFLSDPTNSENDAFYQIQEILAETLDMDLDDIIDNGFPLEKVKSSIRDIFANQHMYMVQKSFTKYYSIVLDAVKYKMPYDELEDLFLEIDIKYVISKYRHYDVPYFHVKFIDIKIEDATKIVNKSTNVILRRLPKVCILNNVYMKINDNGAYDVDIAIKHITL